MINIDRTILAAAKIDTIELRCGSNETVYRRVTPAKFIYVVDEGALCRLRYLPGDRRSITEFLLPGDGFGYEINLKHRDEVRALIPTMLLAARREALLAAARCDPKVANCLFNAGVRAAINLEQQVHILRVKAATEKVAQFLLEMDRRLSIDGKINLPMRRHHIAEYLGVTLETVSRAFAAFQRKDIIKYRDATQIVIINKQRLTQLSSLASDFEFWNIVKARKNEKSHAAIDPVPDR